MLQKIKNWYGKYEVRLGYFSLLLGFFVDSLTLTRIDRLRDIIWIASHIFIASVAIILINKFSNYPKGRFWAKLVLQFAFGGLLSACVIFYFRGATLISNWPFILILIFAFIGNEFLKKHFEKLAFQIAFLFFCVFSFSIFFIPIMLNQIGDMIFLLSGLIALFYISLLVLIFYNNTRERFKQSGRWIFGSILGVYALVNILYFTNLIPPIPLMLKDVGAYYNVSKINGDYVLTGPANTFWNRHSIRPKVLEIGKSVYVYNSIYSPANFNLPIVHEWQHYDDVENKWVTTRKINLSIKGGRADGWRTYSTSNASQIGKWRVNIRTTSGSVIGRVRFNIQ